MLLELQHFAKSFLEQVVDESKGDVNFIYLDFKGLKKEDENFWAARAALTYNEPGKIDRGIFSIYLFNLVNVKKGETTVLNITKK